MLFLCLTETYWLSHQIAHLYADNSVYFHNDSERLIFQSAEKIKRLYFGIMYGFFAARRDRLFLAPPRRHFAHRKKTYNVLRSFCPPTPSHNLLSFTLFLFLGKWKFLREGKVEEREKGKFSDIIECSVRILT